MSTQCNVDVIAEPYSIVFFFFSSCNIRYSPHVNVPSLWSLNVTHATSDGLRVRDDLILKLHRRRKKKKRRWE